MVNASIFDGDYEGVRQQNDAVKGDIVAALIEEEVTVKTFQQVNGSSPSSTAASKPAPSTTKTPPGATGNSTPLDYLSPGMSLLLHQRAKWPVP